jgi:hypothetical protein
VPRKGDASTPGQPQGVWLGRQQQQCRASALHQCRDKLMTSGWGSSSGSGGSSSAGRDGSGCSEHDACHATVSCSMPGPVCASSQQALLRSRLSVNQAWGCPTFSKGGRGARHSWPKQLQEGKVVNSTQPAARRQPNLEGGTVDADTAPNKRMGGRVEPNTASPSLYCGLSGTAWHTR